MAGRSVPQIALLSIFLALLIGGLDHHTGFEISFSVFYIIPITVATGYAGRKTGIFLSVFSAIIWLTVDYASGNAYSNDIIPIWNSVVRLGFFVIIALLLAKARSTLNMIKKMADTDGLPALLNGRAFNASVTRLLDFCRRIRRPITFAYKDLDNFKQVNDTSGHTEGDKVLRAVSSILAKSVRSTDIIRRLGGDESAIALPDTDLLQARIAIEKMRLQPI